LCIQCCRRSRRRATHNVPLADDITDAAYLELLDSWLERVAALKPQLIFYQAGVDALAEDKLGNLNLSRTALNKRNNKIYSLALQSGTPMVVTMGGGYSAPSISASVDAHSDVYRTAALRLAAFLAGDRAART
jgi:acetoin utilization deacetylase AcuC-like enzyme